MADALLGVVFENLTSLLQNEFSTISGIKSKVQKLSNNLVHIKAVLEDAEKKQFKELSIKLWLQDLKDAVYVLDDILDEYSIESCRLRGFTSFKPKNIMFRHKIGNRLEEINGRLDDIADRRKNFFLQEGTGTVQESPNEVAEWRQTSSIIVEPKVFGREDDKKKIIKFLLTQAKDSDFLSIYPVFGLGGLGKTTLLQSIYNDVTVSSNFNTKVWVCVSENFSVNRILCSIIQFITEKKYDGFDLNVTQKKVQELLQGKIYLLVLDDVWNQSVQLESGLTQDKWDHLKSVLSCGSKGSSILVSTRDEDVATIMGTWETHRLSGLSASDCWLLFKQHAFRRYKEHTKFVEIGKEIVKKCNGLPLAAKALGGLMSSKNEEKEWLDIKDSELWALPQENSILPALRLSYFYLTPTLKQCFSFCAIFPKDREILKEELIRLWMANGFISSMGNLDVEDVGNMVWKELYQKSFFQDCKMDEYSGNISFKMHDIVHDLAQSVMGKECVYLENANMTNLTKNTHHISFHSENLLSFDEGAFKKVESLRTLFDLENYIPKKHDHFPLNSSLRVLSTSSLQVPVWSLIHLRYLELGSLDIKKLPNSIYNLQKLEILKIKDCSELSCLPKRLACLQNLRHIVIKRCKSLSLMFPNIGKLTCLRTLSVYIVSLEKGNSLTELCDLNLGGNLSIKGLKNVGSLSEAKAANLMGKKDLHELCLSWISQQESIISAEQVLEELQPHSNLKCFEINYYEGLLLPSWISILSNLISLKLGGCNKVVRLPSIGKLPSLKKLELSDMDNLKYLDDDESQDGMEVSLFPSLEVLRLGWLPNIEGLLKVERGEMFPCLSKLDIWYCPHLGLPCLPSLKDLVVDGCNNELLRSISTFRGLTQLILRKGEGITSFPVGMFKNLTSLQSLVVRSFRQLESLPEQNWEGLQSLRTLQIYNCEGMLAGGYSTPHF